MKIVKKVLTILITIILLLLLTFNIYSFISINVLNKDLVTIGGYSFLEVVSGSMEPTIEIGDIVIIDTKDKDILEGDIITFKDTSGSLVTHRVVSYTDDKMITKGDFNNSNDEEISRDNIVGKYKFKIHHLGLVIKSLQSPMTFVMIFIIGILICFLVSTDKNGEPILDEDEKEFQEFLKHKEELKKELEQEITTKEETPKKNNNKKNNMAKKKTTNKTTSRKRK